MRARRVDANLSEIVAAFRCRGVSVNVRNDDLGDLDLGYGGISMVAEIKNGKLPPSRRKLTPNQIKKRETWTGGIRLIQNLEDVEITVATLRRWHSMFNVEQP